MSQGANAVAVYEHVPELLENIVEAGKVSVTVVTSYVWRRYLTSVFPGEITRTGPLPTAMAERWSYSFEDAKRRQASYCMDYDIWGRTFIFDASLNQCVPKD